MHGRCRGHPPGDWMRKRDGEIRMRLSLLDSAFERPAFLVQLPILPTFSALGLDLGSTRLVVYQFPLTDCSPCVALHVD